MNPTSASVVSSPSSSSTSAVARAVIKVMRPHQWVKNVLVFVPVLLAHQPLNASMLASLGLAFLAFSLTASSVYVINDLVDREFDKHHPHKRHRPFASGRLPVRLGPFLAGGLLAGAAVIALLALPINFAVTLLVYFILTTLYSLWIKRILMLDVLTLAGLYTLRLIAGGFVSDSAVSEWLLALSLFLFISLAFSKRYVELRRLETLSEQPVYGRGYSVEDLSMIESIGPTSGYLAVLVLALYINSEKLGQYYSHPWAVWLICPVMLYWISRIWFLGKRGQLVEDPVVFACRDPISLLLGAMIGVLFLLAG